MTPFLGVTAAIGAVGAGKAAVAEFQRQMRGRPLPMSTQTQADRVPMQMRLAHAGSDVATAEATLRRIVNWNVELAAGAKPATFEQRAFMRLQIAQAVAMCRAAVTSLMNAAGAGAHARANPLQRYFRDVSVMSNHIIYDIDGAAELYGRALLGMEPNNSLY